MSKSNLLDQKVSSGEEKFLLDEKKDKVSELSSEETSNPEKSLQKLRKQLKAIEKEQKSLQKFLRKSWNESSLVKKNYRKKVSELKSRGMTASQQSELEKKTKSLQELEDSRRLVRDQKSERLNELKKKLQELEKKENLLLYEIRQNDPISQIETKISGLKSGKAGTSRTRLQVKRLQQLENKLKKLEQEQKRKNFEEASSGEQGHPMDAVRDIDIELAAILRKNQELQEVKEELKFLNKEKAKFQKEAKQINTDRHNRDFIERQRKKEEKEQKLQEEEKENEPKRGSFIMYQKFRRDRTDDQKLQIQTLETKLQDIYGFHTLTVQDVKDVAKILKENEWLKNWIDEKGRSPLLTMLSHLNPKDSAVVKQLRESLPSLVDETVLFGVEDKKESFRNDYKGRLPLTYLLEIVYDSIRKSKVQDWQLDSVDLLRTMAEQMYSIRKDDFFNNLEKFRSELVPADFNNFVFEKIKADLELKAVISGTKLHEKLQKEFKSQHGQDYKDLESALEKINWGSFLEGTKELEEVVRKTPILKNFIDDKGQSLLSIVLSNVDLQDKKMIDRFSEFQHEFLYESDAKDNQKILFSDDYKGKNLFCNAIDKVDQADNALSKKDQIMIAAQIGFDMYLADSNKFNIHNMALFGSGLVDTKLNQEVFFQTSRKIISQMHKDDPEMDYHKLIDEIFFLLPSHKDELKEEFSKTDQKVKKNLITSKDFNNGLYDSDSENGEPEPSAINLIIREKYAEKVGQEETKFRKK